MLDEIRTIEVPGPHFTDLADRAGNRILMALGTGLGIVDGTKPVADELTLLECRFVGVELIL